MLAPGARRGRPHPEEGAAERKDLRHLAQQEDGDGISGRERTLRDLFDALDAYLAESHPQYPPPAAVSRLSAAGLARATLRRQPAPSHPVFDACEALQRADETLAAFAGEQMRRLNSPQSAAALQAALPKSAGAIRILLLGALDTHPLVSMGK